MSAMKTQLLSSGEFCKLLYDTNLLKVHLPTFLSIPITQKCQNLSCDTLVANELYIVPHVHSGVLFNVNTYLLKAQLPHSIKLSFCLPYNEVLFR